MVTELFSSGHTACTGCGQALGARLVVETTGPNVIIANATGCLEVFTSRYPESAWGSAVDPFIVSECRRRCIRSGGGPEN